MAVHNCAKYLPASIDSILNQTIGSFEFIIIDDGSDGSVAKVLDNYNDRRIRKVRLNKNIGLTKCLNIAIDLARGDIFVRHDGDDIAVPDRFEKELSLLTGRVGLVSCWADAIDENDNIIEDPWTYEGLRQDVSSVEKQLPHKNCILSPGAMFTRKVFNQIGYFDPKVRYAQDYNYWLRLVQYFMIDIVPEVLIHKRIHSDSVWSQILDKPQDWLNVARDRAYQQTIIKKVHHEIIPPCLKNL